MLNYAHNYVADIQPITHWSEIIKDGRDKKKGACIVQRWPFL
jgi:hypothetical protein